MSKRQMCFPDTPSVMLLEYNSFCALLAFSLRSTQNSGRQNRYEQVEKSFRSRINPFGMMLDYDLLMRLRHLKD